MPNLGDLKIRLGLNVTQLRKDLKRSEFLLNRSARKYQSLGASLTTSITLPFLAAAGAGAKLAVDLQTSFGKIENLVGITGDKLDAFKVGVAGLSSQVGKSQAELSGALFAVTSAGLKGAEALQILEQSGKASSIGLGDTTAIARTSTAVLNAYGKENISAARSVDVLTAIVREGNLEAESLAPALGRVVGLGAQLGVSFEELGANVATFTRLGVGAEEAVTALRGIMANFLKPAEGAKKVLAEIGLTAQDVRDKIKNQGLADTLIFLKDQFSGNDEALAELIPNIRALSGVLGTAGSQADTYRTVLENINGATGIVDSGFKKVSRSAGFQFKQALVQLQNVGIELGNLVLPILTKAVRVVSDLVAKFQALSPETKTNILRFTALAASIGPVLTVVGTLKSALGSLAGIAATAVKNIGFALNPLGLTILAIAGTITLVANNWDTVRVQVAKVANAIITAYNENIAFRASVEVIAGLFELALLPLQNMVTAMKQLIAFSELASSGELFQFQVL